MQETITPIRTYVRVGVALLALLVLTVVAAEFDLGPLNIIIALIIAACKALLVILFFMDVRHSNHITWAYAIIGFFWLALLFSLTLGDYITRYWLPHP